MWRDAPAQLDTARDLLLARDALEGLALHLRGPNASAIGLAHGASWIDFITVVWGASGSVAILEAAVLGTWLLGALSIYGILGRLTPASEAVTAALLFLGAAPLLAEYPILWNPSATPLPVLMAWGAGIALYRHGSVRDAVLLGIWTALAADTHLACSLLFFLALPAVALYTRRRPVLGLLAYVGSVALTWVLFSPEALRTNLEILYGRALLWPLLGAGAALFLAGLVLRRRQPARPERSAAVWTVLALLLAAAVAAASSSSYFFAPRYLLSFLPPLVWAPIAAARAAARRLGRGWIVPATGLPLAALLLSIAAEGRAAGGILWTLRDAERMAQVFESRGDSYESLLLALEAPQQRLLIGTLAAFLPWDAALAPPPRETVLVLPVPEAFDSSGRPWPRVPLSRGGSALIVRHPGRVHRDPIWRCDAHGCQAATVRTRPFPDGRPAFLHRHPIVRPYRGLGFGPGDRFRLSIAAGPEQHLRVIDPPQLPCRWRIVGIEGVPYEGTLPARRVRLLDSRRSGTLDLAPEPSALCPAERALTFPPPILQWAEGDPVLGAAIAAAGTEVGASPEGGKATPKR
ncbi:MAG: hypothetical protein D6729_12185 [Deltaproteobacteria bacterium]|nr:MAG: hypothetical protein D6729_12185 [Deltaproteobacteria bacterium]